jgi:1,4-alpha-glucan branching enzyme
MSRREDVEIDLLTSGPGEGAKNYLGYTKHQSDKFVNYKPNRVGMSLLFLADIQLIKIFNKLYASGKRWDVIHVHEWNSVQVGQVAQCTLRVPVVGTMHLCISKLMQDSDCPTDKRAVYTEHDLYLMQMESRLITESDELILCSKAYEKIIRSIFMTQRPINIIYNGIDEEYWEALSFRYTLDENFLARPVALYVGRIADMKGIRPLLKAIEAEDTGYMVLLAGEVNANTEEEKEAWDVTKKIKDLESRYPERIKWLGFQNDQNLKQLYFFADVGIMPSVHEPFGIVALEFMTNGVPLISTEQDGLGEIVVDSNNNEYALIIRTNSAEDINESLKLLRHNAEARKELEELGRKRSKHFDWSVIVDQTVDVYKRAIENVKIK